MHVLGFFVSACMRFRVQLFVRLWSVCLKRVHLEEFLVFGVRLSMRVEELLCMCREFCSGCKQFRAQFFVCLW